jgi:hypothetical protein
MAWRHLTGLLFIVYLGTSTDDLAKAEVETNLLELFDR